MVVARGLGRGWGERGDAGQRASFQLGDVLMHSVVTTVNSMVL